MPMRNVPDPNGEDHIIPGAIVSLVCPRCARGHSFYSHRAAEQAPHEIRSALLPKPPPRF
jgi:hypothetical protein